MLDTAKGKVKKKALKMFLGWSALWGTVSAAWSGTMIFTSGIFSLGSIAGIPLVCLLSGLRVSSKLTKYKESIQINEKIRNQLGGCSYDRLEEILEKCECINEDVFYVDDYIIDFCTADAAYIPDVLYAEKYDHRLEKRGYPIQLWTLKEKNIL